MVPVKLNPRLLIILTVLIVIFATIYILSFWGSLSLVPGGEPQLQLRAEYSFGLGETVWDAVSPQPQQLKEWESKPSFPGSLDEVEKKLRKANVKWLRGVKVREILLEADLMDDNSPWNYAKGVAIWDYFQPTFTCPYKMESIGVHGPSGKWVCGLEKIAKKKGPCVVYSYGVDGDTSFDEDMVKLTNCSMYLFDHTIDITKVQLPKQHPSTVFIEKVGVGAENTEDLRTIRSTMDKYKHDFIDMLKLDVETAEFAVFDHLQADFPKGLPFGQVVMEIHLPGGGYQGYFNKWLTWLTNLEKMGLRPFQRVCDTDHYSDKGYVNMCEYSFINVQYDNYFLHA